MVISELQDMFVVFINVVKRTKGNWSINFSTKTGHTASMRFQKAIKVTAKSIFEIITLL